MKTETAVHTRGKTVQKMFGLIAPRYDLMNRLITAGQDQHWRHLVVQRAKLPTGGRLLDLGTGTGDLAREALRQYPTAKITAADFTLQMMQVGKQHTPAALQWSAADALSLPFADESFDALICGYLLRNVADLDLALYEQLRVLKSGCRLVSLDTTRPVKNLLTPFIHFHMHTVIPALGTLLTGQAEAYRYLPETSENFLSAEDLAERLHQAGFTQVGFERYMFGTMAIHWGIKV